MKKHLANLSTALLVICAIAVTALVVRRELFGAGTTAEMSLQSTKVANWRSFAVGQRIGPENAAVTIVEFSDFECPFCKATADRIRAIMEKHPRDVALVYRHYPLDYHKNALPAARASLCAGAQGRFGAFHDALFAQQDSLGLIPWTRLAREAGVPDQAAFSACLEGAPPPEIERDLQAGIRLGVQGTPTLLVNDRMIRGAPPGTLEELVEEALRTARR